MGFYQSPDWIALRKATTKRWKREGLPCSYCGEPIEWARRYAAIADHVKPIRVRPDLALTPENIVMMHHACHSKKTAWDDLNKKTEIDANGYPVGSEWQ